MTLKKKQKRKQKNKNKKKMATNKQNKAKKNKKNGGRKPSKKFVTCFIRPGSLESCNPFLGGGFFQRKFPEETGKRG